MQSILVETHDMVLLIDPADYKAVIGTGFEIPDYTPPPDLPTSLAYLGLSTEDITHVVLTHAHFDHVSGVTHDVNGRYEPTYPQAIYYLGAPDWENESMRVTHMLEAKGCRVFRMPIGGSVPVGAAGYVNVFLEIMNDQRELDTSFDHIIHATSSGGTQAGLVVGKAMTDWPGKISGIAVTADKQSLEKTALDLSRQTAGLLGGQVGLANLRAVPAAEVGHVEAVGSELE